MLRLLLSYLLGAVATSAVMMFSTFLMTRLLIPEDYGRGMLFISLINLMFYICNLGMDQVFVRFFYEHKYKNNLALLFYRCLFIVSLGTAILISGLLLWGKNLQIWLSFSDFNIIPLFIYSAIVFTLFRFLQLIPRLQEDAWIYNLASLLINLFFLLFFLVIFSFIVKNYWSIILSQLLAMTLTLAGLIILYRKDLCITTNVTKLFFNKKEFSEFLKYGTPSLFSLSLTWVFVNLDKLLILKWSNYKELGIYTAAFSLTAPLILIQTTFNTAWAPKMNQMLINSPFKSKKIFFVTFEKLHVTLVLAFLLLVLLKHQLILFLGTEFQAAKDVFPWLLFCPYFRTLSEVVFAGIIKSKKTYWHIVFSLCAVITNLIGCYCLIPALGAKGAAISVALSFGVFFITRWWAAFRYYQFKIKLAKLIIYPTLICGFIEVSAYEFMRFIVFLIIIGLILYIERSWIFKTRFSLAA